MLKRLKIHRFRHVAPGTELEFSDRYNVLLGKNGTGKTTLLDLISMVLRSDFSSLRGEEFDIEYEFDGHRGKVYTRLVNGKIKSRPHDVRMNRQDTLRPHMNMTVMRDATVYEFDVQGTSLECRKAGKNWPGVALVDVFSGHLFGAIIRAVDSPEDNSMDLGLVYSALAFYGPGTDYACRFDESLGIYQCMTSAEVQLPGNASVPPTIYSHWQVGPNSLLPHILGFYPNSYVPEIPTTGQTTTRVQHPPNCALARFAELSGMQNMAMSLAVEGSALEDGVTTWLLGRAEFLFTTQAGNTFNDNALSYGQKRLLAFLYYLDVNQHYVIADELVNGMHHDWIKAYLELMSTRQAFLTSQNPLLLDYLPLESVEQVQRSFIQCKVRPSDKKSEFVWSNLDAEEAKQLLADYEVGIQRVGELLRVRGLW